MDEYYAYASSQLFSILAKLQSLDGVLLSGSLTGAMNRYLEMFREFPDAREIFATEFRRVLSMVNESLATSHRVEDIYNNFQCVFQLFPNNVYFINDLGQYLHRFGNHMEACRQFQSALSFEPGYVSAEKNLNSVKSFLVERWHYRMLNDKIRNCAYRSAIREALACGPRDSVIDIGAGTGLLTLYAVECHPLTMNAIDSSQTMIDICQSVLLENAKSIKDIKLICNYSLSHDISGDKKTLVITEVFDAGLFGERILKTLIHAWKYIVSPVGRILPSNAEFYVAGANCNFLNLKYRLNSSAKGILNISDEVHVSSTEPYDCDDVHLFKDLKYLTNPHLLLQVDFNNIDDIKKKHECPEPYLVNFNARESGEINIIVGWFTLNLINDVFLTTNPTSDVRANAWQQAIFYDFIPKQVAKDDPFHIKFTSANGKLKLVTENPSLTRISAEMLRFLNDVEYMKMITSSVGSICGYLSQVADITTLALVDLLPFPVFGLNMLKYGAQSVICYAKNVEDKMFIQKVFRANKISEVKFTILLMKELQIEAFRGLKFHAVFCNFIKLCGELDTKMRYIADVLKKYHLLPEGLMLPHKVNLQGQVISSQWLNMTNRVSDTNVHDFKIAQFINKYQVSQNFCIDIEHLEYEPLSDPVFIAALNSDPESVVINVTLNKDGVANAVLCWYTLQIMEHEMSITTKRANSFVDGIVFLAYPEIITKVGQNGNILFCVDGWQGGGIFKLILDVD